MDLLELRATNFCCFGNFTLPLYKQGLVWVSGANCDTQAADNNGAGKSSLFKALTWCIWGDTIDGEKGDKVIRKGEKEARTELLMRDGTGSNWTIVRERSKGAPRLTLIQPDGKSYNALKLAVQDKINEMIGLDFQAFKNTVLYGQNDSARFAHPKTKDSERKEMLHRILRTGILGACHRVALAKKRKNKDEVSQAESDERAYQDAIRFKSDVLSRDALSELTFEAQRQKEIDALEEEKKEKAKDAARWVEKAKSVEKEDKSEEMEGLEREAAKIKKEIVSARKAKADLKEIKQKIVDARLGRDSYKRLYDNATWNVNAKRKSLQELKGDKCPVCTSPLTSGHAKQHRDDLQTELENAKAEAEKNKKGFDEASEKLGELESDERIFSDAAGREPTLLEKLSKNREALSELEKNADAIEAERRLYIERAEKELESARRCSKQIAAIQAKANPHSESIAKTKKMIDGDKENLHKAQEKKDALLLEASHIEFWVRGFSNQGLPSYILDGVMPYISSRANHYLETLSDGDIKLEFRTQREKKSSKGEFRDEIDIAWEIEGVSDSYPPSGGQLKKMEIAVDLALMDLVATREGNHIDLLVLDEVLDGLDSEGIQRVLLLLGEMRTKRQSIFVISHEADMSDIFEKAVFVEKHGQESKVKVIS